MFDNDHSGSAQDVKANKRPALVKGDEPFWKRARLLVDEQGDAFVERKDTWEKRIVRPSGKDIEKGTEAT